MAGSAAYTAYTAAGRIGGAEAAIVPNGLEGMQGEVVAEEGVGGMASIDPDRVRFSQGSVRYRFQDGSTIDDLAEGLRAGTVRASGVPPIRLVERDGELFTLDNRRLEAFRRAGVECPYRMATPQEIADEAWKFTTRNGGTSIRVRGEP